MELAKVDRGRQGAIAAGGDAREQVALQMPDQAQHPLDGVVAGLRRACVRGLANRLDGHPHDAPLGRDDGVRSRRAQAQQVRSHEASLTQKAHAMRPQAFLVRYEGEGHGPVRRPAPLGDLPGQPQVDGHGALAVRRPQSVKPIAIAGEGERIGPPVRPLPCPDRVDMGVEDEVR